MIKRAVLIFFFVISGVLVCQSYTQAGFGISPPFIRSKNPIFPGSHFEQNINLLRSSADEPLIAKIIVDAPDIANWITIDKGDEFVMPAGELKVPMVVNIDVPASADVGHYTGYINVQTVPEKRAGGGVAIALGARIDIDLEVTNEEKIDFVVRRVRVLNTEQLTRPWNWPIFSWFLYRLQVSMDVENIGNVKAGPTKAELDVYDLTQKNLLESHRDTSIGKIEPFTRNTVLATFPTKLAPGNYWGQVRIYYNDEIVHQDRVTFEVYPPGGLPGGLDLGRTPWLLAGGTILILLDILLLLFKIKIWRIIYHLLFIISWPLRFAYGKTKHFWQRLKIGFWRWLHKKAAKYQPVDKADSDTEDENRND